LVVDRRPHERGWRARHAQNDEAQATRRREFDERGAGDARRRGSSSRTSVAEPTGWRCSTFEQFQWAVADIGEISPHVCRAWAEANFSIERVGAMYEEFFRSVMNVATGKGWYEPNPSRRDLDWLMRRHSGRGCLALQRDFLILTIL
jgi:hypothetical protein